MLDVGEGYPHGNMRRKDREITERAEIDTIIRSAKVMRIALADGGMPFVVPVFYVYDGTALHFHSARAGTKIEIMKRNPNICFEISVDHGIIESEVACDFEARHRTVIGIGKAVFVHDEVEKSEALDRIVALFSDKTFEYTNFKGATVVRIDIDSVKGKKHGF